MSNETANTNFKNVVDVSNSSSALLSGVSDLNLQSALFANKSLAVTADTLVAVPLSCGQLQSAVLHQLHIKSTGATAGVTNLTIALADIQSCLGLNAVGDAALINVVLSGDALAADQSVQFNGTEILVGGAAGIGQTSVVAEIAVTTVTSGVVTAMSVTPLARTVLIPNIA